jgi:DNA-binding CsgD family transcriptional regulator
MSRSNRLTLRDMRRVHEMMEQAAELGVEPDGWRGLLMDQTRHLLRARVAITMDSAGVAPGAIPRLISPLSMGWEECDLRGYLEYHRSGQVTQDPAAVTLFELHERVRLVTANRRQLADDDEWYASPSVSEGRRSANIDDFVSSSAAIAPHVLQGFIFYRDWGDTPFTAKDRRLLRYTHLCLLRRLRDSAHDYRRVSVEYELSPRLAQTFQLLLGGDGVKNIADELGVSLHTVNGYVKTVYRKLKVRSRVELISAARRRQPKPFVLPHDFTLAVRGAGWRRPAMPVNSESEDGDDGQVELEGT